MFWLLLWGKVRDNEVSWYVVMTPLFITEVVLWLAGKEDRKIKSSLLFCYFFSHADKITNEPP